MSGQRIHLAAVDSTNSYTTELLSHSDIPAWTVVTTDHQWTGRGQRGRTWQSEPGYNLLCSVVLKPRIQAMDQFLISAAMSLAVVDVLCSFELDATIKWPNDVLIEGKKVAGMLIENQISGNAIEWSVAGLGLNVNQVAFEEFNWPATSMAQFLGRTIDRELVLKRLLNHLVKRCAQMESNARGLIVEYHSALYGLHQWLTFQVGTELIEAILDGIDDQGALILNVNGEKRIFFNGEIRLQRIAD